MRFAIAIAVLALSGVALVLGIGQRTFLAPPEAVSYSLEDSADLHYAVIPAEMFDRVPGEPSVTVEGADAFIATGSQRDIDAWVEMFDHATIESDTQTRSLISTAVDAKLPEVDTADAEADDADATGEAGDETAPADGTSEGSNETAVEPVTYLAPQGSDLWIYEAAPVAEIATLKSFALNPEQAVIVSAGSDEALQGAVTITWTQDQRTPWAGPLLVGGGVLALIGAVLYLLAVDHRHRGLGPRRGRRGPLQGIRGSIARKRHARSVKRMAAPAALLAGVLLLSGCSASDWPDFSQAEAQPTELPVASSEIAPVPVTHTQIERILRDVVNVADVADETLDGELLKERFDSDALVQRQASYTIRAAVPDYSLIPPHITSQELGYTLVQSTQGWPRTMLIALASDSDTEGDETDTAETADPLESAEGESTESTPDEPASPSLALVLTQDSPHENYLVSRVISLRGGITMPEAAPAEDGTALLASNLQTLVLQPGEVASEFSAILQGGLEVAEAEHFRFADDDPLITQSGLAWVQRSQERASADGYSIQYSVNVQPGTEPITALSVSDGGALVVVTVIEDRVSDTAGSTTRVRAEGAVTALSGLSGQQTRLVNSVAHQLMFYVPSKVSGGQVELLGATSEMVGASN